jgi:hypothetical protein
VIRGQYGENLIGRNNDFCEHDLVIFKIINRYKIDQTKKKFKKNNRSFAKLKKTTLQFRLFLIIRMIILLL